MIFYTNFSNKTFWTEVCWYHLSLWDRHRCITCFPYAVSHQVWGMWVVSLFPQTCISIYTCASTSEFQLIFWGEWRMGWGATREAAPKNGWTVRYISKSIQCALNVPVRIHLGHQRQNWAHDILCFTGYPDWAPHRDLVVTCGLKLWSLVTIWFWTQVRHERFSKIMRLLAYFIVAIGRQQTGIDFEQYAQKK